MARLLLLQGLWEPARMQSAGFAFALEPWLKSCYAGDAAGLRAARERHLAYFNTQPYAAWLIAGVVCSLEEKAAAASPSDRGVLAARVVALKKSMGAALAGIADGFFWGALRPFSALAGMAAALTALRLGIPGAVAWGLAIALLTYNIPAFMVRWYGFTRGYALGEAAVLATTQLPAQAWTRRLRLATAGGAVLVAVLTASVPGVDAAARARLLLASVGGLALSWKGIPLAVQLAAAAAAGMLAALAGWSLR